MESSSGSSDNNTSIMSREKLDQVASWVSTTVISVFFASLERCSCVNLSTTHDNDDDDDDDGEEANDRPLAPSAATHPNDIV